MDSISIFMAHSEHKSHKIEDSNIKMATILLLQGPNLNLLGTREPDIYGSQTLDDIYNTLLNQVQNHQLEQFQSNHEGQMIDRIHQAKSEGVDIILFNPAAWTHTSIALRDALSAVEIPFIEIHLSNTHAREAFRQNSYFSDIALGVISGLGIQSYELALTAALTHIEKSH